MRGDILHYDNGQGLGVIGGDDGTRYAFESRDLRQANAAKRAARVDFRADAGRAREIFLAPGRKPAGAQAATGGSRLAETGLWRYFRDALTRNYANFRGRAPRKEYWSFALFWVVALAAVATIGLALDGAFGGSSFEAPVITAILCAAFVLATFLPALGMMIRRQHDIGLSGWFVLLSLIPSVGNLIMLVFTLVPSQKHDNKWGPVPESLTS
jgi:uncharacterized membrane protein YhaH (DUF805 family)